MLGKCKLHFPIKNYLRVYTLHWSHMFRLYNAFVAMFQQQFSMATPSQLLSAFIYHFSLALLILNGLDVVQHADLLPLFLLHGHRTAIQATKTSVSCHVTVHWIRVHRPLIGWQLVDINSSSRS